MGSEHEARCGNCRFFHRDRPGENSGTCRRYPPRIMELGHDPDDLPWPESWAEEWCGEHQPRRITGKAADNGQRTIRG